MLPLSAITTDKHGTTTRLVAGDVVKQGAFGDFQNQARGVDAAGDHRVPQLRQGQRIGDLTRGDIQRDREVEAEQAPFVQLTAGGFQGPGADVANQARFLGQGNEVEGILEFPLLGDPARHHLQADQTAVAQPDHRLEVGHNPPFPQGSEEPLFR